MLQSLLNPLVGEGVAESLQRKEGNKRGFLGLAPCGTEVWPVEGAQAHTKLEGIGGGGGKGTMIKEWEGAGRRGREHKASCSFPCLGGSSHRLLRTTLQTSGRILCHLPSLPFLHFIHPFIKTFSEYFWSIQVLELHSGKTVMVPDLRKLKFQWERQLLEWDSAG